MPDARPTAAIFSTTNDDDTAAIPEQYNVQPTLVHGTWTLWVSDGYGNQYGADDGRQVDRGASYRPRNPATHGSHTGSVSGLVRELPSSLSNHILLESPYIVLS